MWRKMLLNGLRSCRTMERLINRRNTLPTVIRQRPLVSFAIANNLLTPSTKATDLGISSWTIITTIWNNFENPEDGSSSMKHLEICSYTIPKNPLDDKWGTKAQAWANIILSKTKMCSILKWKISEGTRFEGGGVVGAGQQWCLLNE